MDVLLWIGISFLFGALPYSVWIGQLNGVDIRQYGDHNPGATNVLRGTGSKFWFIVAVIFDIGKGVMPAALAYHYFGWTDLRLVPVGAAAILGHAFSPFLGFNGGKAIAVSGGVWMGILTFEAGLILCGVLVLLFALLTSSDWVAVFTSGIWLIYLLIVHPDPAFIALAAFNLGLIIFKHRAGLNQWPRLRIARKDTAA
jgi:acyl phosphate:glycerol-3-phosphate acyltransferase